MRLLLALLLLLPVMPAIAQDADLEQRKLLAHQLVEITTAEAVMGPMVDAIWPTVEAQLRGGNSGADEAVFTELKVAFTAELATAMASVVDDFAALYADAFTQPELQEIVTFYGSDSGKKLIAQQPKLMQQMLPSLTTKLQIGLPAVVKTVMEEAKKKGLKTEGP